MKKINEIFYSLQGEGYHTGTAAVFVRFSGCNLSCAFCDTQHEEGMMMSDKQIVDEILKYPQAQIVVLTGGEPSLFITEEFVAMLKSATKKTIAIETNGTHPLPRNIDWITLSPKSGFDGGDSHKVIIDKCNELKVVYMGQNLNKYFNIVASHYFLQPCGTSNNSVNMQNLNNTIDAILKDGRWRLSLQTHKIINVR